MNNKLKVKWKKQKEDLNITYPLGIQTVCDAHYVADIFNKEFIKDMQERGYDITTLKFEITVDKNHKQYKDKFPTLSSIE